MYDVIVVGAGPAGATVARLVGARFRTLLVERRAPGARALGARRAKCCGGLLAPEAQRALAALGLGVPGKVLVGPQLFAVRAIDVPSRLERHYPRHCLNVDRGLFDAWLRSLVPPEVAVREGCRVTALRGPLLHRALRSGRRGRAPPRRGRAGPLREAGAGARGRRRRARALARARGGDALPPLRRSHLVTAAGRVALVGEAAGFISPSSAEGLSYALRSAAALAAGLLEDPGRGAARYHADTRALRSEILLKTFKAPFLYAPALRRVIMRSGVGSVPVGEGPLPHLPAGAPTR